jgi:isomerase DpgB
MTEPVEASDGRTGADHLLIQIDGKRSLSRDSVAALETVCDGGEDCGGRSAVIVHVSGAPGAQWASDLPTALLSKWERGLRRLERLPTVTIAVADGDCGGTALDALLATDYRIASASTRLLLPVVAGATWPGMALYRLVRQAGVGQARRAALFGAPIDASAALAMGVIDELAADMRAAVAKAADIAEGTELAIRRQLMLDASATSFEDALGAHLAACDRVLRRARAGGA